MTDYWLVVWVQFISPFGTSSGIISISTLDKYAFISRTTNFALREDLGLTIYLEAVLSPRCPNTYPSYCTDITHLLIGKPWGDFYALTLVTEHFGLYQ